MKTDGVWVIVWAQLDIQAREAGWDPRAGAGGEVGRESRTAEVSSARGQGLEGAWRVGRSEHETGQRAGPRKVHELRLDALAERIAQGELRHLRHTAAQPLNLCHRARGVSPFQHGIVSSTRPLPIRTNITRQGKPLKAVRHNMRPNPPPAGQANNEGAHGTGAALQPSRQACHLSKL